MAANRKTDSTEIIAAIRDVTVTYDGYLTRALARVNLEVRRGEILGVLGAEGAGKSTLLRMIAGRQRPTEGAVKVFGRSPRWGSIRARIGYVPEKSGQDRPRGFFERIFRRKTESQASMRGVPSLTQAVMGGRDLVLLDEPFADATPAEKAELSALIRELVGRGKTVIISGDSLADAKDICDRLLVLHEGRVHATGSLEELLGASGALRFLAGVLPPDLAGRIAKILSDELAVKAIPAQPAPPSEKDAKEKTGTNPSPDERLTRLVKPTESAQPGEVPPSPAPGAIDHDKLEELTKPSKPE